MIRKFLTPVPGQGLIEFIWQLLGLLDERGNDRLRVLVGHLRQHYVARVTFDQGRDIAVFRTGQEIALPMTGYCPIFNRCRPQRAMSDIEAARRIAFVLERGKRELENQKLKALERS